MSSDAPSPRDYRQEATDAIIRLMEAGTAPWQKPWQAGAFAIPINPTTDKPYRGGNAFYLLSVAMKRGYSDPRWMTYKQAAENGWQVRKGEKGTQIEFWDVKPVIGERTPDERPDDETPEKRESRLIHKVYTVFNARQIDRIPPYEPTRRTEFDALEAGERILANSGATIHHDQRDRAFYNRKEDAIHLPPRSQFQDALGYYGTVLHELAHWTGHPDRLNRPTLNEDYAFGNANYAKEELRAELASVFLAAELGIPHDPASHASYVASWIKALKDDKNELFRAASDASKAADYLLALEKGKPLPTKPTAAPASSSLSEPKAEPAPQLTSDPTPENVASDANPEPPETKTAPVAPPATHAERVKKRREQTLTLDLDFG